MVTYSTIWKLHGKLATAQLRARTRKITENMTAEQKDDSIFLHLGGPVQEPCSLGF
ncbi:hypothetical protein DICVIV_12896 [Dictyocaulus viviparus]|uniref:Uncharacterized protein n=1 Tax=Dictyocaulus viviparus TaxID=29172 RepID=A0A0D8X962_DICVI|nr:hypothetical protein DICVIV_12896 [Dictyocaulus viviparus]